MRMPSVLQTWSAEYNHLFGIENEKSVDVEHRVADDLRNKQAGHADSDAVLKIKGLIRWVKLRQEHL